MINKETAMRQVRDIRRSSRDFSSLNSINNVLFPNKKLIDTKRAQKSSADIALMRLEAQKMQGMPAHVLDFVGLAGMAYVVFGGVGDLLLLCAEAVNDPSAKVVWFANEQSAEFGKRFLNLFGIQNYVTKNIMGSGQANLVIDLIKSMNRLATSAHLADNLDYEDWRRDTEKYKKRLTFNADWLHKYGKHDEFKNKQTVVICPSGSVKMESRQRYLEKHEYDEIVKIYLEKGFNVISTGSDNDRKIYFDYKLKNTYWLSMDSFSDAFGESKKIDFKEFIQYINSGLEIISMDTYLKTYAALCGIRVKVLDNRHYGRYADNKDCSDYIFLNTDLWSSMSIHRIDDFIKNKAFV
jgi:hypothetical protein